MQRNLEHPITPFVVAHKASALAWAMMPQLRQRVVAFCRQYGNDADPGEVLRFVDVMFTADDPQGLLIGVYDDYGAVKAHLLAVLCDWFGTRYVLVMQYEIDKGFALGRDWLKEMFSRVEEWARKAGAKDIRCVADSPALARAYRTYYGMEGGQRVWMRKAL